MNFLLPNFQARNQFGIGHLEALLTKVNYKIKTQGVFTTMMLNGSMRKHSLIE